MSNDFEAVAAAISARGWGFAVNNGFDWGAGFRKTTPRIFYEALIWPHVGQDAPRWVGKGETPLQAMDAACRAAEAALAPEMLEERAA